MQRNPGRSSTVRTWSAALMAVGAGLFLLSTSSTGQGGRYPFLDIVVVYPFSTIEQGNSSAFGYLCDSLLVDGSTPPTALDHCYAPDVTPAFEGIFRSECAWRSFWAAHQGGAGPAPFVDFDRKVVVAVVSPPLSTGGFHLEISSITRDRIGNRRIGLQLEVPCPGSPVTLAFTNPYHFVQVAKEALPPDAPILFAHDDPSMGRRARVGAVAAPAPIRD